MTFDFKRFQDEGYFIHEFKQLSALDEIQKLCTSLCRETFKTEFTELAKYHELVISAEQHDKFQFLVYQKINELKLHQQFVSDNIDFFISIIGPDIDLQTNTYLRISRPGQELDNIGMHRDTDYGNSAFEISISLPLITQTQGCGLNIVPKSHLLTEHIVEQVNREDVEKGTNKNEMGFLYAPKHLKNLQDEQLKNISLPFGSGLGFSLGLIHGQKVNTSNMTRWSIDFRFKNSFHPMTKNLKKGYYTNFNRGSVTALAEVYYKNNESEETLLIKPCNSVNND
ncbi:hypothetical protein [Thalassotalea agariperforans]